MIALGVGFSSRCSEDALTDLVAAVLTELEAEHGVPPSDGLLATAAHKRRGDLLEAVAARLGLAPVYVDHPAMQAAQTRVPGDSPAARQAVGLGSVAEAAAMAVLGDDGRLLVPTRRGVLATCAAATGSPRSQ